MKPSHRLSVVASVIAALCIAPAAFAKPKNNQQGGGGGGKKGTGGGQSAVVDAPSAPGGAQAGGPGGAGAGGPGPGGVGIVIVRPPFPPRPRPPVYRRTYQRSADYVDSNVAAVQRALRTRGYYTGPVDGDAGSGTRSAIRGFREDNGLVSTSIIDATLLRALGL